MKQFQINLKVDSKAKDIINQMLIERNGFGANYIGGVVDTICFQLKQLQGVSDIKFRNKLIAMLIQSKKSNIETDSVLPLDMKTHLQSFIHTIGKTHIRSNVPTYVVFDPVTMKLGSIKEKRTINSATKLCKNRSNADKKDYIFDTLENYKKLKYKHETQSK
jgi:hypothetical protein